MITRGGRRFAGSVWAVSLTVAGSVVQPLGAPAVGATGLVVDDAAELRQAITDLNGAADGAPDVITLGNAGPFLLTCGTNEHVNADGDLDYTSADDLTITYAGAGRATIAVDQTTPCTNERVFEHRGNGTVTLEHLVIADGDVSDTEGFTNGSGGGVKSTFAGELQLLDVVVEDNRAGDAGAVGSPLGGMGGGVYVHSGSLVVTDSIIRGNRAGDGADATAVASGGTGGAGGGLATWSGAIELVGTQVQSNRAGDGGAASPTGFAGLGGVGGGVAVVSSGSLTVTGGAIGGAAPDLGNEAGDAGEAAAAGGGRTGGSGGGVAGGFDQPTVLTGVEIANNRAGGSRNTDLSTSQHTGGHGGGVFSPGPLVLDGVAVHHNTAGPGASRTTEDGDAGGNGGGVYSFGSTATLHITDSVINDNVAGQGGDSAGATPGIGGSGGGILHGGVGLTIERTEIARNAGGAGGGSSGGVGRAGGNGGGLRISNFSASVPTVTIVDSTIADNTAGPGGNGSSGDGTGGSGGGAAFTGGSSTVIRSLLAGNTGARFGGGVYATADVTFANTTFDANESTDHGGAIYGGAGTRTLTAVTFTGNGAPIGGSLFEGLNDYSVTRTVIAEPASASNCGGGASSIDGGHNVEQHPTGVATCGVGAAVVDPLGFGPLRDNGGGTHTRLPAAGSPVVDAIAAADCVETDDQRGIVRPSGVGCDVGAVELDQTLSVQPDSASGLGDELAVDVLANDSSTEVPLDPASVTVMSGPSAGTTDVDPVTGVITYSPTGAGDESDSFTYRVCLLDIDPIRCGAAVVDVDLTRPDSTPAGFTFTDVTGVAVGTVQTSNAITVAGVNQPAPISVTGGTYSVNGGTFRSSAGTVEAGDTVRARHTASSKPSTSVGTTVTIGGVTDTFTSTTAAPLKQKPGPDPAPAGATTFVPLDPQRLFDTRFGDGLPAAGTIGAGETIDVQVGGELGVPLDAAAVVINLTVIRPTAKGFLTAFPAGTDVPNASNLNVTEPGQIRPNLTIVPMSPDGKISVFSSVEAHLLGDVAGYYRSADVAVADGRLVPLTPTRLFDTRPAATEVPGIKGYVGAGDTITVQVAGHAGVPTTGASAVVLNVTGIRSGGAGNFVTVYPTGQDRPIASNLNLGAGDTAANLVIVPLGDDGSIELYTFAGAFLLADVTGYITDDTAATALAGLFVPLEPGRLFDTREGTEPPGPKGFVPADGTITAQITGVAGVPDDAAAVALNVTGIRAPAGFVTVSPTGQERPNASTLNLLGDADNRPNAAVLPVGDGGGLDFFTSAGAHLAADVSGYFLG